MTSFFEVFRHFFYLGCISFGGPAAHLGYFHRYFVQQKAWLSSNNYSQLIALSQFLPGPSSSQVAFAIGYQRFGLLGASAAFLGFTLPAFLLMYVIAVSSGYFQQSTSFMGITLGLKLFAVVIVADAVLTMARTFCQNNLTLIIALLSTLILIFFPTLTAQLTVLVLAGLATLIIKQSAFKQLAEDSETAILSASKNNVNKPALLAFVILFISALLLVNQQGLLGLFADFYQSGALVFGGGHVVLPLLQTSLSGDLTNDSFLLGYSAAQAMPGPMFTLATYLGAELNSQAPFVGALVATLAIFLPGFLLILSFYHAWQQVAHQPQIAAMVLGINAAVVGLLCVALYQPIALSALHSWQDCLYVLAGLVLLRLLKTPVIILIIAFAALGVLLVQM